MGEVARRPETERTISVSSLFEHLDFKLQVKDSLKSSLPLHIFQCSIVLTLSEHNPDMLSMANKFQALVYNADAFFHAEHYKKAEV